MPPSAIRNCLETFINGLLNINENGRYRRRPQPGPDMFTRVYELMLSAQRGVCMLDITLMDRAGELGRVLTKISEKTGAELLLSYAYADTRSKIGHAILIYECGGEGGVE